MKPATNRVVGVVVDLLGRAELLDTAVVHDRDAIRQGHRLDLVVGDVDGGDPKLVTQVLELRAHGDPELRVEVRERLVHQEHLRGAHDGPRERDPLALAAGEGAGLAVEQLLELDLGRRRPYALANLPGAPHAPYLQRVGDVLPHRHVRIEPVVLKHHGDVAVLGQLVVDHPSANQDLARGRLLEPGDHPHGGGLSAPRRSEQDEELLVVYLE